MEAGFPDRVYDNPLGVRSDPIFWQKKNPKPHETKCGLWEAPEIYPM